MKVRIYKVKDDTDVNVFGENNWGLLPPQVGFILYKDIKLDRDSEAVQAIHEAYNQYADIVCHGKNEEYLRSLGLTFMEKEDSKTKRGIIALSDSDECWDALCSWRIEISFNEDGWLRLHPLDFSFPNPFYPADIIDKYAGDIIKEELERGTIEEIYVDEEGNPGKEGEEEDWYA